MLLLLGLSGFAQKKDWGKVTVADLQEKSCSIDTSAAAAVLYNGAKTTFKYDRVKGFTAVHEYQMRIKIYKPEGLKWANFEVPYYVGYENISDDWLKFSDGVTYNLENGQIVKTKLTGQGTFKKDMNEYWNMGSITMPNVKAGSVIEFKYTLKSADLGEFPVFHFQYPIPVKYTQYITEIPEFYIYKPVILGYDYVKSDGKIERGHFTFDNKYNQMVSVDFQSVNSVYTGENLPALKEEGYLDNIANYRSSVQHELDRIRWPEEPEKQISTTWEGVAKTIYKDKRFGPELEQRQFFEQDVPALAKSSAPMQERVTAVLEHVKRTMTWDNKYGYNTKKGVRQAYKDKVGNVAEVNFILISMLNYSGLPAYPVLVSTVDNGVPAFPNLRVFNYVVVGVEIDGKMTLLDATDKYAAVGILPQRACNWNGRLIRRDGSSQEINMMPSLISRQNINLMGQIDATGKVSGKVRANLTDFEAHDFRTSFAGQNPEQYQERLEERLGADVSEYGCENKTDCTKPITETYSFVSSELVEQIGGKMYVNPMVFLAESKNPFVMDQRILPVFFGHPKQMRYNINLQVPDGYAVESVPQSVSITTGENVCNFNFNLVHKDNRIQLNVTHETNSAFVSAGFYPALKEFYRKMIEKQQEKIVLKKI